MKETAIIQKRVTNNLSAFSENRDVSAGMHVVRAKACVKIIVEELMANPSYNRPIDKEDADSHFDPVVAKAFPA